MTIIAWDPGAKRIGWAIYHDETRYTAGSFRLPLTDIASRLVSLRKTVAGIIEDAHVAVECWAVEGGGPWESVPGRSTYAAQSQLNLVRGALLALSAEYEPARTLLVPVGDVREALCGSRTAGKPEIAQSMRLRGYTLPLRQAGYGAHVLVDADALDALALAAYVDIMDHWGWPDIGRFTAPVSTYRAAVKAGGGDETEGT